VTAARASHASLDVAARERKAAKVRALLAEVVDLEGAHVLEVGTGSGAIAASLAEAVGPLGRVEAIDVVDERVVTEGVHFTRVEGTDVPFGDGSFDVVISNHVIEHVGDRSEQLRHLRELRRVLRPGGWAYLAMPNRWRVVEPHFKLPLLSWLPAGLRSRYVRLAGRGEHYDCDPMSRRELQALVTEAGLEAHDRTFAAVHVVRRVEAPQGLSRLALAVPARVLALGRPLVPTEIVLLRRPS
jgi:2-polyprenyl-3-methyl-5-hydroxy-6-metoxy-1,4-benzoquinol methylase